MVCAPEQGVLPSITGAAAKRGKAPARQSGLELIPVHTLVKERIGHSRGFGAKPVRMEVDHDTGVRADTFHGLPVGVGCTSSTPKEVGDAWTRGDFSTVHHVLYVTQSRALCRRQAVKVGIVWFQVDCSSRPSEIQCNRWAGRVSQSISLVAEWQ
jgi:hypothetical protein